MEKNNENLIAIYQTEDGSLNIKVDDNGQNILANQKEIAQLFNVNIRTINGHINNIFKTNEMNRESTIRKFRIVREEGKRKVEREIEYYDLDVILSVGYRVNSKNAIKFRQWAASVLHKHIVDGWTINQSRIKENYNQFIEAMQSTKKLLPNKNIVSNSDILELIKTYANAWFSIDAYDKDKLIDKGKTEQTIDLTIDELKEAIKQLKENLTKDGIATELFAAERQKESIESIFGNIMQSKTVEEKASHLFYFIIKNHPFVDGNKRTGAYSFIWFLQKNNILNLNKITPEALTALTILIAESNPKDKEKMIRLILQLLK